MELEAINEDYLSPIACLNQSATIYILHILIELKFMFQNKSGLLANC